MIIFENYLKISTIQENNAPKKMAEEQAFLKKSTTLEFGKTICSFEFPTYVTSNLLKGFFINLVTEKFITIYFF